MKEKYRLLRVMAVIYKILAWVSLVVGVIVSIFALAASSLIAQQLGAAGAAGGGFILFLGIVVYSLISFGSLYALGEGIDLLFDIEQQTRKTEEKMAETKKAA
jgi:vacuolar-type H+-ATPase subunit I/STV1